MIRKLFIALAVCLPFASTANAVDITLTFTNATTEEARAAQWWLTQVNADLPAEQQHATIKDYIIAQIKAEWLPRWIQLEAEARDRENDLRTLWQNAPNERRAAALAALRGE